MGDPIMMTDILVLFNWCMGFIILCKSESNYCFGNLNLIPTFWLKQWNLQLLFYLLNIQQNCRYISNSIFRITKCVFAHTFCFRFFNNSITFVQLAFNCIFNVEPCFYNRKGRKRLVLKENIVIEIPSLLKVLFKHHWTKFICMFAFSCSFFSSFSLSRAHR